MVVTLHLVREPLGIAHLRRLRPDRRDFAEASFVQPLSLLRLMPRPAAHLTSYGIFAVWPVDGALERFRDSPTGRRLRSAETRLELVLEPLQSHGSWRGAEPLDGRRGEAGGHPVLFVTRARLRTMSLPMFFKRIGDVAVNLRDRDGLLWALGFTEGAFMSYFGTLSLWRDAHAGTGFAYGAGEHRDAIRAEKRGGWFEESWFARLALANVEGEWPNLDVWLLRRALAGSSASVEAGR